jgi:myo-inositol-1(or 4)-monophosphatase
LVEAFLATGFHPEDAYLNLPIFADITYKAFATRRTGSAAIDCCFTACGLFDGFWEYHLKPWDIAAGTVILQEAGGQYSNFDGTKLDFKKEKFLCSNGFLHPILIKEIKIALKKGFK